jgi:hypothetical protein
VDKRSSSYTVDRTGIPMAATGRKAIPVMDHCLPGKKFSERAGVKHPANSKNAAAKRGDRGGHGLSARDGWHHLHQIRSFPTVPPFCPIGNVASWTELHDYGRLATLLGPDAED